MKDNIEGDGESAVVCPAMALERNRVIQATCRHAGGCRVDPGND